MTRVKFLLDQGFYCSYDASNIEMCILANFLTDDASYNPSSFKQFALNDWEEYTSSNATALEKDNGYILLSDLYSEEKVPTIVKITQNQYIKLLDDWKEKVLTLRPKKIVIRYENDEFIIETNN